jgi:hypothetical protein
MTSGARGRIENIMAAVEDLRARHFWLAASTPRWDHARRLARELGIDVVTQPILDIAYIVGFPGAYVAVLRNDLRGRRSTQVLLHEIGHAVLHMRDEHGIARNLHPCRRGDPREAEAELFARMLYYGHKAGPDNNPKIAEAIAAIEGAAHRKRLAAQIELPLSQPMPVYISPAERQAGHGSAANITADDVYPWTRKRRGPILLPAPHSPYFDWSKNGKPLGWFVGSIGWVWVYDGMLIGRSGKPRWEVWECGDRRTQRRRFIVSPTEKRDYYFAEGEKRSRTVDALAKQFATATTSNIPMREHAQTTVRRHDPR